MAKTEWLKRIEDARRPFRDWERQGEKIVEQYRRKPGETRSNNRARFGAIWSNVQALRPALFSRTPTVIAERRHRDRDPIGRVAAEVITRAANQEIERNGLQRVMEQVVLDVLLVGRGVPWVRYEADRGENGFTNQRTVIDHVDRRDFVHSEARTWAEVARDGWVARRVMLTRAQGRKRFGAKFANVEFTVRKHGDREDTAGAGEAKYAQVWEVWDKATRKQLFVAKHRGDEILEERADPYLLEGFFPCPRPAFATLSNDDLIATPDPVQYQDQADELDEISTRIRRLTEALKLAGIYDSSAEGLAQLMAADDGTMIPVQGLQGLEAGRGGLDSVMRFLPVAEVAQVLTHLYSARDQAKAVLDQVSGVADLVRGQVDPREKASQSKIKASFVSQRLDQRRRAVEECARDLIRIAVEMMVELFPEDRLRQQSGFDLIDEVQAQKAQYEAQAAAWEEASAAFKQAITAPPMPQMDEQGQPVPPPQPEDPGPPPEDPVEGLWQSVVELIRNDKVRGFRVDVESDSTVEMDQARRKEERMEMLEAVGGFLSNAFPVMQESPDLAPAIGEMLSYTVRGYNAGRGLEGAVEEAVTKIRERAEAAAEAEAQPPPEEQPPPDPRAEATAAHAQANADRVAQQAQIDAAKAGPAVRKAEAEAAEAETRAAQMQSGFAL